MASASTSCTFNSWVISTNVTSFYREETHFDFITEVFSRWVDEGQKRFRFWSAACSTGEEPYTLAVTLLEALNSGKADIKILATDISTRALTAAMAGTYTAKKAEKIPPKFLKRYFTKSGKGEDASYTVVADLKRMIVFRRLNLSMPPFPMKGPLDMIMCRNVMIYFDNAVRLRLLADFDRLLKPKGNLIVGHAESLTGMISDFTVIRPSIYCK